MSGSSVSVGSGLATAGGAISIMTCAEGQVLKYTGGTWACAAIQGGTQDAILNGTASQSASFNINGLGQMDAGIVSGKLLVGLTSATPNAASNPTLTVRGSPPLSGQGLVSVNQDSTQVSGAGSSFTTQASVGDVLRIQLSDGGTEAHRLVQISAANAATVDEAWNSVELNRSYSIEKTIAVFETQGGADVFSVLSNRQVFASVGYQRACPAGTTAVYGNLCVTTVAPVTTTYQAANLLCRRGGGHVCAVDELQAACDWSRAGNVPVVTGFGDSAANTGAIPANIWMGGTLSAPGDALVTAANLTALSNCVASTVNATTAVAITTTHSYRCCYDIGR